MDTYQNAGAGDLQATTDGAGGGEGIPEALWHLDPVDVEVEPNILSWVEKCSAYGAGYAYCWLA